jgi:hypothetical protein
MATETDITADELLRRYLLATLGPELLESVERRVFSDDRIFWEHLALVEDQLIDDYVWDRLDASDKTAFESGFLVTRERLAKVEFARALRNRLGSTDTIPIVRSSSWLGRPVSMPVWAAAAAAVFLLVVVPGAAWRLGSSRATGDRVVATTLGAGQFRGIDDSLPRIQVGPACQLVQLPLETTHQEYATYSAALFLVDDEASDVLSASRLTASKAQGRATVTLTLPCAMLTEGDYFVRLRGNLANGAPVDLEKFPFRVLRP